ncbi:MAG: DUF4856 domain-containing protein [Pseudomonadota bacterium]
MHSNRTRLATGVAMLALIASAQAAIANDNVYADFPVTVKGYKGKKSTSVAYTGQIARHVLHDSLKKIVDTNDAKSPAASKAKMLSYYKGKDAGRGIVHPKSKGSFKVLQANVDEISKSKELIGKTFKGTVTGMPNNMTGPELVEFWISKAAAAPKGLDLDNGYNYGQLISKFIMGAVSYNQAVDNYLDEKLSADNKPNDKPYSKGAPYTGKEHSWDEAFGYFGTPAHTLKLTPAQVYEIQKQGSKSKPPENALKAADFNKDGKVDLKTEMTFGPAYYAAGFDASVYDKGDGTKYLHTITRAFLDGRKVITDAKGEKLTDAQRAKLVAYAKTIRENWEKVLAEATYKYAGSVYKDMFKLKTIVDAKGDTSKVFKDYVKHWGELKGFSLALQTGKDNLGETATRLNRLIGFGPVLLNASQVVDVDSKGNYVRDQGPSWGEYMLHMVKVQKLLAEKFGLKAKNNEISGDVATLAKSLGAGTGAEND